MTKGWYKRIASRQVNFYLFLYSITCSHCQIWIVQRKVVPRDTNISVKTKISHSSITIYITRQWIELGRIPACLSVMRFARTFIILQFVCSASMSLRASSDCILAKCGLGANGLKGRSLYAGTMEFVKSNIRCTYYTCTCNQS